MPGPRPQAVARVATLLFVSLIVLVAVLVSANAAVLPRCGLCHGKGTFAKATSATAHGKVACSDCHGGGSLGTSVTFGFQQAGHLASGLLMMPGSDAANVTNDRCLKCHGEVTKTVVNGNGLRMRHAVCARGVRCVECHSNVAHGKETRWPRTYNMDMCLHCHGPVPRLAKCDLCHAEKRTTDRLTTGPWKVTHGPNWQQAHGMGDQFTCPTCHAKDYCDKCHGPGLPHSPDFRSTHPKYAADPRAKCTMCHRSEFCTDCHGGLQMPHPAGFVETHKSTVGTSGETVCRKCHSKTDCSTCHVMHVHPGDAALRSANATAAK